VAAELGLVPAKRGGRRLRPAVARRWVAVGILVLVGLLYYRPLRAYVDAHGQLSQRSATVHRLREEEAALQRRVKASSSPEVLAREARSLGYVHKGEHLIIVKDIPRWRKRQRAGTTARRAQ
jgi:cell division protein FtsB